MRIAIIGAGNVGSAIARAGVRAGNDVVVTATDPSGPEAVANDTGARTAGSNAAAVQDADVVVLAVPYPAVASVAREIADGAADRVVIDVTKPMTPDYSGLAVTDRSAAEQLQEALPRARVVKAFNTVLASNQADPVVDGTPLDGFYAGDDHDSVCPGVMGSVNRVATTGTLRFTTRCTPHGSLRALHERRVEDDVRGRARPRSRGQHGRLPRRFACP